MAKPPSHPATSYDSATPTAKPQELGMRERLLAAGGASVVSALIVNPLDVIKTRMQTHSAASTSTKGDAGPCCDSPVPVCRSVHPVRSVAKHGKMFAHILHKLQIPACSYTAGCAPQLTINSSGVCACAEAGLLGAGQGSFQATWRPQAAGLTMRGTLERIIHQEGARSLWRGLDSALLMSLPSVLVYYPLYDKLQQKAANDLQLGYAGPALAGATARCITAALVSPLELVRTRQQAAPAPSLAPSASHISQTASPSQSHASSRPHAAGMGPGHTRGPSGLSTWAVLRASLSGTHAAGPAAAASQRPASLLAAAPRLWVGFGATLARDVPFSALYWALVEPMRAAMLAASPSPSSSSAVCVQPVWQGTADVGSSGSSSQSDRDISSTVGAHTGKAGPGSVRLSQQLDSDASLATQHGTGTSLQPASSLPANNSGPSSLSPSRSQLVWANLVAGTTAGVVAAAATTPFDVVKTRLQTAHVHGAATPHVQGTAAVLQHIWQQEGARGLFAGVVPRAVRCAPACAVVVASYELLKTVLG